MSRNWWPTRKAGQSISDSLILGDVVQLSGIGGDLTISTEQPPYKLSDVSGAAAPLPPDLARTQPSRLLLAQHRIVPFAGRADVLNTLAKWAETEDQMAVQMIHAAGGHGKTRLAAEITAGRTAAGWTVWQAIQAPGTGHRSQLTLPPQAAMVIVDYADRWPPSALMTLLTQLRQIGLNATIPIRVLLLARSAGYWWQAVADTAESDLAVPTEQLALPQLPIAENASALFAEAAGRFAAVLGVRPPLPTPGEHHHEHILALHMAALATVEAQRNGDQLPTQPHAISAYLLRRESAYWQHLHARAEVPIHTRPAVMHRVVYTATLTGAVSRTDARRTLTGAALADTVPESDRIIDDHCTCYPPADPATVFEPLLPDRLGEDLIALTTPGHPHNNVAFPVDDWALTAATALVENHTNQAPPWLPASITTLVETARRWPHIAATILFPLVRRRPDLAIAAGGATLARLASIENVDPALLETIESALPASRRVDFDIAAATISTVLTRYRLARTEDPAGQAQLHNIHALRLSAVGRHEEALTATEKATAIYRVLVQENPDVYLPDLAASLHHHGACLADAGHDEDALSATAQAAEIRRQFTGDENAAALAMSLSNLGIHLAANGQLAEALTATDEALAIHRRLVASDRARYLPDLASSLNNIGIRLARLGRWDDALAPAQEATAIYRELMMRDAEAWLPSFAESLSNLGNRLAQNKQTDEAARLTEEATGIYRKLVNSNPGGWRPHLAGSLNNLGNRLFGVDRPEEAANALAESVDLYRDLAATNPTAWRHELAMALTNFGNRLSVLDRPAQAIRAAEEAVAMHRHLAAAHPKARRPDLATALRAYAWVCLNVDDNLPKALECATEAVDIFFLLAQGLPQAFAQKLYDATQTQADLLERLGRTAEADAARYRFFPKKEKTLGP